MVDKLANVKLLVEDVLYPVIRLRNRVGQLPYITTPFSDQFNAYLAAVGDLAAAISMDDPAWRGEKANDPPTEAPANATVKGLYKRMQRDAVGIRRFAPYSQGMTDRQLIVFGQDQDPPGDCFLTRLHDAIKLDDPTWVP